MILGVIKFFCKGSCEEYPNQSMLQLINLDKFAGFSIDQIKMMISFLQPITEDHDYALQVLLPELMVLLLVNIFAISKEEARQHMLDLQFFSYSLEQFPGAICF